MRRPRPRLSAAPWLLLFFLSCAAPEAVEEPAAYVDPFIGTDAHGHTHPGASMPFGMVQLSPQTRLGGWDGASGYHYSDSEIYGFAHTALSGTGVGDYGDVLLVPAVGEPALKNTAVGEPALINTDYRSPFRKRSEQARPGYYRVFLDKPAVLAELTATTRAGYHRYTFPATSEAAIVIDLEHRDRVLDSYLEFVSDTEVRGLRRSSNWAKDMVWYFHIEFSRPFARRGLAVDNIVREGVDLARGTNVKGWVGFDAAAGEPLEIKVALSAVDPQGALRNLRAELPGWDFEAVREQAYNAWNEQLGVIKVGGGSREQRTVFYTALYHAFLQPNTFMDVDGRYRGIDKQTHLAEGFTNYTVFSLWDTYRAWHPLMTILDQARTRDFVNVMLEMYRAGGLLPVWELAANETYCMIGNHALSVIADAYIKGIRGFDAEAALEAMLHSATRDHFGLAAYREHGHIPGHLEHESISKTLEYAYNDWCIAVMARELGRDEIYREYIRRAQYYKNIFDHTTGLMRPRVNGGWLDPFDPTVVDWHFTEANAWQYGFYVPHDITGLFRLHGGRERLAQRLDELFETESRIGGRDMKDISGLIGQYAHGNEPSHHMAYLYNFVGQPWKTQRRVRHIMDGFYSRRPDGLCGNEDCGQMSAWLIMSALGFYPVTPGRPEYIIGTPWFPEAEIRLENGNVFRITADGVSRRDFYIQSAELNGQPLTRTFLGHDEIMRGGHLRFVMGSRPDKDRGSREEDLPATVIEDELLLPVPYIEAGERRIREPRRVGIGAIVPGCEIYYTTDGSRPHRGSLRYREPVLIQESASLRAIAYKEGFGYSFPVEAEFVKLDLSRTVELRYPPHRSYRAGGPEALIDGIRGADNWRLGGWHGYQGTDFEALIDLGRGTPISYLAAGFVQDIGSWIWMPTEVVFSVSLDGERFDEVLRVESGVATDDYSVVRRDLGGAVSAEARYVRVAAANFGTIPDWHLGAGGQAFIFIDEVLVK